MNPNNDQLPTVSTFRVEKPGKSKFAPSIGGRKATSTSAVTPANTNEAVVVDPVPESADVVVHETEKESVASQVTLEAEIESTSSITAAATAVQGKKIESIQSRRLTTSETTTTTAPLTGNKILKGQQHHQHQQQIKLPEGPKNAASIATSTTNSERPVGKRTMAYFLKDSGEGREMASVMAADKSSLNQHSLSGSTTSEPAPLSPSKTRRIVNLRNIKAPPRSSSTSTALAPQVRVVDGAIVYDEKFAAAVSISGSSSATAEVEQELEYVDEDDEHGKHLTSATYSSNAKGSNRWNSQETDLFYEALSMCGTDFSMVQTLFPHRTRAQIKGKYKLEEKTNPARISAAFKSKIPFDPTFKDRVQEKIKKKQ